MSARVAIWNGVLVIAGAFAALTSSCQKERTGTVAGPPLTVAPSPASESTPLRWTSEAEPVQAAFVDLSATPVKLPLGTCEMIVVRPATGTASVLGESLAAGDVLLVQGEGSIEVSGQGLAVLAAVRERPCDPAQAVTKKIARASVAPALAWSSGGGTMRAHLDVEKETSSYAYFGRLEGTAPVAEHAHPGVWEIVCTLEGAGTFTLAGEARRLGPRSIVSVPPDTKHSWQPDPGTTLVAFQIYDPPGPEQRFKALAASAAHANDAGSAASAPK
jgi:quercetin dioxygenase-like cupin family protein